MVKIPERYELNSADVKEAVEYWFRNHKCVELKKAELEVVLHGNSLGVGVVEATVTKKDS